MEHNDESGVILPFRQDAAFLHRCANRYLDEDDVLSAAQYANRAYRMEPKNAEYAITFAEVLNRMHRYEQSVAVLLFIAPFEELPIDALFGLTSDFMGLELFSAAQHCGEMCLMHDPEGPYAERVEEMLDLIDDRDELEYQIGLDEGEKIELLDGIRVAKAAFYSGDYATAGSILEDMEAEYPTSDILDMEIALNLFSRAEYEEAEKRLFRILQRNSRHIRAHLLLALIYTIFSAFTSIAMGLSFLIRTLFLDKNSISLAVVFGLDLSAFGFTMIYHSFII